MKESEFRKAFDADINRWDIDRQVREDETVALAKKAGVNFDPEALDLSKLCSIGDSLVVLDELGRHKKPTAHMCREVVRRCEAVEAAVGYVEYMERCGRAGLRQVTDFASELRVILEGTK